MPTSDDYARATIKAGLDLGITPRGIKMGLACNLVEAGPMAGTPPGPILMYANPKVPESLKLPHDATSTDGLSVGTFQQQVRRGNGGAWWWGDAATCMDPYKSAVLFFTRLRNLNYNNTSRSPGAYVQDVQGSAYPDRYDQRMAEASDLYDRLTANTNPPPSNGTPPMPVTVDPQITHRMTAGNNGRRDHDDYVVGHTQEGGTGDAIGLANYCKNAGVSYNGVVDDVNTVLLVAEDLAPWAAVEANEWGFHICFAGSYARWGRGKWLETDAADGLNEDAMLWRGARLAAWAATKYGIPIKWVGNDGRTGWPPEPRGFCGHVDFGQRGGGHTDPGVGFPKEEFIRRVQSLIAPPPNLINQAADVAKAWIGKRLQTEETPLIAKGGIKIGAFVKYENAHVYWRAGERSAFVVPHGGLFEAWAARGWESGPLGFPVRDFTKLPDGAVQAFQNGVLLRQDGAPDGHPVWGIIGQRYAKEGYEDGPLGYPISDEYDNGTGGRRQDFENGSLDWDPSGAVQILNKGE